MATTTKIDPNVKTFTLVLNKETKGAVRYSDDDGHSVYFRKEELKVEGKAGFPQQIKLQATLVW